MIAKSHRWQKTIMAVATTALCILWESDAAALSLGRIIVQSALGEPLRAEIEVPNINAEEAASLKTFVALPEAFRAAGLEYNPAMSGLQVTLQKHSDGRAYIRLSSERTINDPFVDMLIEASWATGHIVRDYTLLFDPPSLRQTASVAPTPAQVPAQTTIPKPVSQAVAPGLATSRPVAATTRLVPLQPDTIKKLSERALGKELPGNTGQVTVKPGDTASKIAIASKPTNVSLDQMLVALLRVNPNAFVHANVNRIKAGSVVNIPTAEQAATTPATEATEIIIAQSKDFNNFRNQFAGSALSAQVASTNRTISGNVQARVEDIKQPATASDKLTLSKGAIQGKSAENQLAQERNAKEAASRAAEIAQNINDLNKIGAASNVAVPTQPTSATTPLQFDSTLALTAVATGSVPAPAASATATNPTTSASERTAPPKPVASTVVKRPATVPVAQVEPGLIDGLTENPLLPAAAIGLIALLTGFVFYRIKQRKSATQIDSTFLESRLQPDSFFGAGSGESVDTNKSPATGSSMMFSPSQLNAVDDVDPVAEADVYLAYGRDLQAEEILKEALRANPERISIYHKLLDLFVKRRDTKAFEALATQAFKVTHGNGPDWKRFRELGLSIDPGNVLYLPDGQPNNPDVTPMSTTPADHTSNSTSGADTLTTKPQTTETLAPQASHSVDLDLNLEFSIDAEPDNAFTETPSNKVETGINRQTANLTLSAQNLDLKLTPQAIEPLETGAAAPKTAPIELSLPDQDSTDPQPLANQAPLAPAVPDSGMLEFDLGSLSLDLDDKPATSATTPTENPFETKLALAQEFHSIGDDHGARILIEEVISEASGDLKIKAQNALKDLRAK